MRLSSVRRHALTFALCVLAVAAVLALRIGGASDLHQNTDQSKTLMFTADCVVNGEWILPRDGLGNTTRKPPLINWLAAPAFAAGLHSELAAKLPSLAAGLATAAVVGLLSARLFRRLGGNALDDRDRRLADLAAPLAACAAAAWLASNTGAKHVYFFRPDTLMFAGLAAGFAAATVALEQTEPGRRRRWLLAMWLAAGLAALAKGPLALLVPVYAALLAVALPREAEGPSRLRRAASLGWLWGVPLLLAPPAAWLLPAWLLDPSHVERGLFGEEIAGRVTGEGQLADIALAAVRVPGFFFERFAPWAGLALVGLLSILLSGGLRGLARHPLMPCVLWIALVAVVNVAAGAEAGSGVAPAFAAVAPLAVYGVARLVALLDHHGEHGWLGRSPAIAASLAFAFGVFWAGREAFFSRGAETGLGERILAFSREARKVVGDEPVVFVSTWHSPVPFFMGRTRAGQPTPAAFVAAAWVVMPIDDRFEPVLASGPLVQLHAQLHRALGDEIEGLGTPPEMRAPHPGLGLYRRETLTPDVLDRPDTDI